MVDFTAYRHPVLAVPCPTVASGFYAGRKAEADRQFIAQHGANANIERTAEGWRIDPDGRSRSGQSS